MLPITSKTLIQELVTDANITLNDADLEFLAKSSPKLITHVTKLLDKYECTVSSETFTGMVELLHYELACEFVRFPNLEQVCMLMRSVACLLSAIDTSGNQLKLGLSASTEYNFKQSFALAAEDSHVLIQSLLRKVESLASRTTNDQLLIDQRIRIISLIHEVSELRAQVTDLMDEVTKHKSIIV